MKLDLLFYYFSPFILQGLKIIKRRILNPKIVSTIKFNKHEDNICCILGNGPSLIESVNKYKKFILNHDCIVVNHFAENSLFVELKPSYYLLADPAFWLSPEKMAPWLRDKILKCIYAIRDNTTWKLKVIVPNTAFNTFFSTEMDKNKNISIIYYNSYDYRLYHNELKKYKYWDKNLISPPCQNVINTAIYLALFWNYQDSYLFGIDSTFFNSLNVDQKTNILYNEDKHFYGTNKRIWYKDIEGKQPARVHEITEMFTTMFRLYWDLRGYADYKHLNIYNSSEYSMVDAFKRKFPEEC